MTIPQNVNFNKSLVNIIDEKPTCPENKFLFNNTLNCYGKKLLIKIVLKDV